MIKVPTAHGSARVKLHPAPRARHVLALGHGAGGGIGAGDLLAARDAALELGITVALVEQPYRVAGRRAPAPAGQLDAAWLAVMSWLRGHLGSPALICGGRSSGARVACRTAAAAGAEAVVCLAFPLHPPGRLERTRLPELDLVEVPTLVVQGERDPFGIPPGAARRSVVVVPGNHSLRSTGRVRDAVSLWLGQLPR
ncbi:MAG TPA: alpha/beta family hydrolase [Solirubrobacteraceae bacterium]|nr:alpha/beta family hydrolase [Solirubrobacteraceae bacterium]